MSVNEMDNVEGDDSIMKVCVCVCVSVCVCVCV